MDEYIEYIFLENFIINFVLMYFVKKYSNQKISIICFVIGITIISIYASISVMYKEILNLLFIKFLVILIGVFIIFIPKSVALYFRIFSYYLIIYLVFLGSIISQTIIFEIDTSFFINKVILYVLSLIETYLIIGFMWKVWKRFIKKDKFSIKIKILDEVLNGFIDTGNEVIGLNNKPVIFIDDSYKEKFQKNKILRIGYDTSISTINGKDIAKIYILKKIIIKMDKKEKVFKNVNVIFTSNIKQKEYDAIVGYDFYLEIL